jgi:RHS repeat-associated protein
LVNAVRPISWTSWCSAVLPVIGLLVLAPGWRGLGTAIGSQTLDPATPPTMPGTMLPPKVPIVPGPASLGYLPASSDVSPTGSYSHSMPIDVPPGRNGMEPRLSLEYNSRSGNGLLGVGFSLGGEVMSTITRCHKTIASEGISDGIDYDPAGAESDAFCLDGNKLVAINGVYGGDGTEYRTAHEIFAQVFSYHGASSNAPQTFVVKLKNGRIRTYTAAAIPRYSATKTAYTALDGTFYQRWNLAKEEDRSGNQILYTWQAIKVQGSDKVYGVSFRPVTIVYTAHAKGLPPQRTITFAYEDRRDRAQFGWQAGVHFLAHERLESITMTAPSPPAATVPVWRYVFDYGSSEFSGSSLLVGVKKCGLPGGTTCTWKKTFQWYAAAKDGSPWTEKLIDTQAFAYHAANRIAPYSYAFDADGDGADELIVQRATAWDTPNVLFYRNLKGAPIIQTAAANGSTFTSDQRIDTALPLDLEADGRSEVFLTREVTPGNCDDKIVRWDASGQKFVTVWTLPIDSCGTVNYPTRPGLLFDLNGDGLLDFLRTPNLGPNAPDVWTVSMNLSGSFEPAPFWQTPITRDVAITNAVDFDGDGRVEIYGRNFHTKARATHARDDASGWVTENDTTDKYPPLGDEHSTKTAKQRAAEFHIHGDFNGDGLQDYLHFVPPLSYQANTNTYTCPDGWGCQWDGATLAWVGFLRWNTGNGFGPESTVPLNEFVSVNCNSNPNNITEVCGATEVAVRVTDINGDGRQDLVLFAHRVGKTLANDIRVLISSGESSSGSGVGFSRHTIASGAGFWNKPFEFGATNWIPESAYTSSTLGDFNGDGFLDIARVVPFGACSEVPNTSITCPDASIKLLLQTPQYADYLKSVTDEPTKWPREVIKYSTAISDRPEASAGCAYPKRCIQPGIVVVREVESRAHVLNPPVIAPTMPAARTLYYSYEDPVADVRGRGFLGFRKFRIWDPSRPMEEVYEFNNHTPWPAIDGPYLYALRPFRVTSVVPLDPVEGGAGTPASKANARVTRALYTGTLLTFNDGRSYADLPYGYQIDEWEQGVTIDWGPLDGINPTSEHIYTVTQPVTTLRARRGSGVIYDGYGNETSRTDTVVRPNVFDTGSTMTMTSTFDYSLASSWLVTLPTKRVITATEYDNPSISASRTVEFDYEASGAGRLWHIYRERNDADTSLRQTVTFAYDTYGNITGIQRQVADTTVPVRETRFEYEPMWPGQPDERIFVSQIWGPFTPLEYRPSSWIAFHPAYGLPSATRDMNGVTAQIIYDELGRTTSVAQPGVAVMNAVYAGRPDTYGGLNGLQSTVTQAGSQIVFRDDALGRVVQEQHKAFDGTLVSNDVVYDVLGRVVQDYRPHQGTLAQAVYKAKLGYDPLDRPRQVVLPDNTAVTYQYDFFSTTIVDALGKKTQIERDVSGRVVKSSGFLGTTKATTQYSYVPFGQLRRVTDPATGTTVGHEVAFTYDTLGRRIEMIHPDHGTIATTYSGFDEVTKERHAATGEETTFAFDALGRAISRTGPDGARTYTWDTQPNGIGKLATAISPGEVHLAYAYDGQGRPSRVRQTVDASDYEVSYTYNSQFGHPEEVRYPAIDATNTPGLTVKYTYNAPGYLSEVGYSTNQNAYTKLFTVKERTLDDQLRIATFGGATPALTLTRDYDPATGRPTKINAVNSASASVFNLAYSYFSNGLVSARTDSVIQRTERFTYDDINRLSTWRATYNNTNRLTAYDYTTDGNLKTVRLNGTLIEENTYGQNGASPHALTSQLLNGTTSTTSAYDFRGRQTTDGTRTVVGYTQDNLPRQVTADGTTWAYSYDALGERVHVAGPRTTTYVSRIYEKRTEGGVTTHVFHVNGMDGPIAELTRPDASATPTVNFLVTDALGSVAAVASSAGAISSRLFFEPFGKRINADGSSFTGAVGVLTQGFTGHEHDYALGMINMKGRVNDPEVRRFLTPDPIVSNGINGQDLNGYSYVRNSPVNLTDPTGLWTKNSVCGLDGFTDCDSLQPPGTGSSQTLPGDSGQSPQGDLSWLNQGQKTHEGVRTGGGSKAKQPGDNELDKKNKGAAPMKSSGPTELPDCGPGETGDCMIVVIGDPVQARPCEGYGDQGCYYEVGFIDWELFASTPLGDWIVQHPVQGPLLPLAVSAVALDVAFFSRGAASSALFARVPAFSTLLGAAAANPGLYRQLYAIYQMAGHRVQGVYAYMSSSGQWYVGMSNHLLRRLSEHMRSGKLPELNVASSLQIVEELQPGIQRALVFATEAQAMGFYGQAGPLANQINSPGARILYQHFGITGGPW